MFRYFSCAFPAFSKQVFDRSNKRGFYCLPMLFENAADVLVISRDVEAGMRRIYFTEWSFEEA